MTVNKKELLGHSKSNSLERSNRSLNVREYVSGRGFSGPGQASMFSDAIIPPLWRFPESKQAQEDTSSSYFPVVKVMSRCVDRRSGS